MAGKRAANFLIGKVVVDGTNSTASTVKISQSSTDNNVKTVSGSTTAVTGTVTTSASVTSVALAASVYDVAEKTDLTTSAFQLASNANTYGTRVTNTSSNGNVLYVGSSSVTNTRFIRRIFAGESGWFEVSNSNLLYCYGSAASTKFTYGGY